MPITPTSTLSKNYQALGIDEIANDIETVFNAVNALPSPKIYKALLTQAGTDAPTAVVLENSLGFIPTYSYSNVGIYSIHGTFPLGLTTCIIHAGYGSGYMADVDGFCVADTINIGTVNASGVYENDVLGAGCMSTIIIEVFA